MHLAQAYQVKPLERTGIQAVEPLAVLDAPWIACIHQARWS